jgi:hypothetical protein
MSAVDEVTAGLTTASLHEAADIDTKNNTVRQSKNGTLNSGRKLSSRKPTSNRRKGNMSSRKSNHSALSGEYKGYGPLP